MLLWLSCRFDPQSIRRRRNERTNSDDASDCGCVRRKRVNETRRVKRMDVNENNCVQYKLKLNLGEIEISRQAHHPTELAILTGEFASRRRRRSFSCSSMCSLVRVGSKARNLFAIRQLWQEHLASLLALTRSDLPPPPLLTRNHCWCCSARGSLLLNFSLNFNLTHERVKSQPHGSR